ncbi:AN1-type zinc finger protein 2B [Chelonia mydas]|uniref:AN1-type zinc finger protein 2B n=1 Tax=Chelonia mydas TaxID=8469 RepID=M7BES0_CHEMY|nr:AN1-type zinc finger protein 2B [Chelonia mydas]
MDVQVPVCPLCNSPIPVRRGEMPDIVVGAHMDRDCKYDPTQQKQRIFTNKCLKEGCKRKEMMKLVCNQCHGNFCIKHRHPLDHDCKVGGHPISKAGIEKNKKNTEMKEEKRRKKSKRHVAENEQPVHETEPKKKKQNLEVNAQE